MAPIYKLPTNADGKFIDPPVGCWPSAFGWRGQESRCIEFCRFTEDPDIELITKLYFDEEGAVRPDLQAVNSAIPTLRGTVVIASYLVGANGNVALDVKRLYGDDGIKEILRDPARRSPNNRIPCNQDYLLEKTSEVQSMPEILPKSSHFA